MLPYKSTNPRTVKGAEKRGWFKVSPHKNTVKHYGLSYLGMTIQASRLSEGYYVSQFLPKLVFMFEDPKDALFFTLKWDGNS